MSIPRSLPLLAAAALLAAPAAAHAVGEYEPNDTATQAVGPLLGGEVSTTIETSNDEDWFFFYTAGQSQFTVTLSRDPECPGATRFKQLRLYDGTDGRQLKYIYKTKSSTTDRETFAYTSPAAQMYQLKIEGGGVPNCVIRFAVDPAASLAPSLATPVPTPPPVITSPGTAGPLPTASPTLIQRRVSIKRRGSTYSGRLIAQPASAACLGGVTLVLRRQGKGSRSYGTTVTRPDGTWSKRRKGLKGRIYVHAYGFDGDRESCTSVQSRAIRAR